VCGWVLEGLRVDGLLESLRKSQGCGTGWEFNFSQRDLVRVYGLLNGRQSKAAKES
jgi:hypothetical protein